MLSSAASELLARVAAAHGAPPPAVPLVDPRDLRDAAALFALDEPWLLPRLIEGGAAASSVDRLREQLAGFAGKKAPVAFFDGVESARAAVLRRARAIAPARPRVLVVGDRSAAHGDVAAIETLRIGDFDGACERLLAQGDDFAAVFVEPWLPRAGSAAALDRLLAVARQRGVATVVDESRTAARAAATTVHRELGLAADHVVLGPSIACGLPFAAVVGALPGVAEGMPHPVAAVAVAAVLLADGNGVLAELERVGAGLRSVVDRVADREKLAIEWCGPAGMPALRFAGQEDADGGLIEHHFGLELAALGWRVDGPLLFPPALRGEATGLADAFERALVRVRVLLVAFGSYLSGGIPWVFGDGAPVLRERGVCQYRFPRRGPTRIAPAPRGVGMRIAFAKGPLGEITSSGFYLPTALRGDLDVEARYVLHAWSPGPDSACLGLFLQNAASTARYYSQVMSTADRPDERTVAAGLAGRVSARLPAPADSGWLRLLRSGPVVRAFHRPTTDAPWTELGASENVPGDDLFVGAKIWSKQHCAGLVADIVELIVRGEVAAEQTPLLGPVPDPAG